MMKGLAQNGVHSGTAGRWRLPKVLPNFTEGLTHMGARVKAAQINDFVARVARTSCDGASSPIKADAALVAAAEKRSTRGSTEGVARLGGVAKAKQQQQQQQQQRLNRLKRQNTRSSNVSAESCSSRSSASHRLTKALDRVVQNTISNSQFSKAARDTIATRLSVIRNKCATPFHGLSHLSLTR